MMKCIKKYSVLILLIVALIPMVAFLNQGLPITHDGQDHVARIANFYRSLSEGNVIPRWAANLNWGYGHPILMFLYPLPSYIASLFHAVGLSFVDSTKLVFVIAYVASGLAMYIWMKEAFGKRVGVIGSILYLFAPYRFVDIYVRGAIGEHVAFIFPPLVLYFLYKLAKDRKNTFTGIGLSVSMACFILSHNAISIMFLPIIGLYLLYVFFTDGKKSNGFLLTSVWYLLLGFGLSSFFLLPAFFEGKYTLRDIVTSGEAMQRFVPPLMFLYSPWNYGGGNDITKMIGLSQLIGLGAAIALWLKTKELSKKIIMSVLFVLFIGSLFMMTEWSRILWTNITLLQKFQFPWRFLSVSTFLAAALGGLAVAAFTLKSKITTAIVLSVFCVFSVVSTIHMWQPKGYQQKGESFYTGIYLSTTDTGESSPIWSTRFMEYVYDRPITVIDGAAAIKEIKRTSIVHEYEIDVAKPTRFVENTVYFPGWNVFVDGRKMDIEFQDPNHRGLLTFYAPEGKHIVRVQFEDTKLRFMANIISVVSLGVLILGGVILSLWRKKV
ncbi:MAG: 6-pyruvoyl-tetrahydropterin synthase-related protein [Candidatus Gottesmanbacteria bacterium]